MKFYLVIFVFLASFFQETIAQTCDPSVDCTMFDTGITVPDPKNCENYYICLHDGNGDLIPSATSFTCPIGQYYKADPLYEGHCVPKTNLICDDNYCGKLLGSQLNLCLTECPGPIPTFVAKYHSCINYYACIEEDGTMIPYICPSEIPYFNGTYCVSDESQCCDFDVAFCPEAGTSIPDPNDCRSFYICGGAGEIPSESYRLSCNWDQHYDAETYTCIDGRC